MSEPISDLVAPLRGMEPVLNEGVYVYKVHSDLQVDRIIE